MLVRRFDRTCASPCSLGPTRVCVDLRAASSPHAVPVGSRVRARALRLSFAVLVIATGSWLALRRPAPSAASSLPDAPDGFTPLLEFDAPCRFSADEALSFASTLERTASARWQRVPFALHEGPRAWLEMSEAEACYQAGHERVGRLRSAALRRTYELELERRFMRARLSLHAATRGWHAGERARPRADTARQQVAVLLALLERAPSRAEPLRYALIQLARNDAAGAPDRSPAAHARDSVRFTGVAPNEVRP